MSTRHGRTLATLAVAFSVVACGGGGGGGGSTPAPGPASASAATVTITPKGPIVVGDFTGAAFTTMAEGTVAAANLAAGEAIYLRLRATNGALSVPPTQLVTPNQPFRIALTPKGELTPGDYAGQIEYTACRDALCNNAYGPPVSVAYSLDIWSLGEWSTIQRDSTHTGFVPTTIDATRLGLIWEWRPPAPRVAGDPAFITRPATVSDYVIVLAGHTPSSGPQDEALYSIGEHNGQTRWSYAIPDGEYAQAPATSSLVNEQVFLQTLNSPSLLTSLDRETGAVRYAMPRGTATNVRTLAPTTYAGLTFYNAGANGGELHAIENGSGSVLWTHQRTSTHPGTPAARRGEVFYQSGRTIEILEMLTGASRGQINDPASDGASSPFQRSVIALGSRGNVIAVSYSGATGAYPLSSFNIDGRRWEWTTQHSYRTFAVSDGVVYAYREGATVATLDAIDEATGQLQWSWSPPAADAQARTTGNIMLTQNLVFISTEGNTGSSVVWALDRSTRRAVWQYPGGGYVVMSGARTIYVLSGPGNGRPSDVLRAFRIR